ncbi:hypothetical protein Tco_0982779, partial [Tanacetum coccineum]
IPTDPYHTPTFIQPSPQPQKSQKPRRPKKKDTQVPQSSVPSDNVADEAVYKELDNSLVRAATTASSLEVEQDSGGGPRRQETMGDTIAQTRFENVSKLSNDPLLTRGNTLRSGEDSLKLTELMELCTNLQQRVLNLEKTKTTQAEEIDDVDAEMFDVNTLTGDEVFAEQEVAAKDVNLTIDEVTLAQALAALKSVKPKVDIQAKIKVDHELAQRLQVEEQEELSVEEKAKLFQQLLDQRRKHFAAKSAEEKRNKPPTQAQQRKIMCTYRKNMEGKKPKDMKNKSLILFQRCLTELSRG